jgi:hypothetical protein
MTSLPTPTVAKLAGSDPTVSKTDLLDKKDDEGFFGGSFHLVGLEAREMVETLDMVDGQAVPT